MKDASVLTGSFDLDDLERLTKAVSFWETEFDGERHGIKGILECVIPKLRELGEDKEGDIPEDKRAEFQEFVEGLTTKMVKDFRARDSVLSDLQPKRHEEALMLKANLLLMKRRMIKEVGEKLMEVPPPDAPPAPVEEVPPIKKKK